MHSDKKQNNDTAQRELAQQAADGNAVARKQVTELVEPIITYQTSRFCKRFCKENRYHYRCTLTPPMTGAKDDAAMCDWGNGSYGWMLDDLTKADRLQTFEARNNATLFDYLYQIANSLPFYERWKNWRFGRNTYVPAYIKELSPIAAAVFLSLKSGDSISLIAQKLVRSEVDIEQLCQRIVVELTKRRRLYLLNQESTVSLTNADANDDQSASEMDIAVYDTPLDVIDDQARLKSAWQQLSKIEQYVLECLVIEDQDASVVLESLKLLNISLKDGVEAKHMNRQQLYYFKRKALNHLSEILKENI